MKSYKRYVWYIIRHKWYTFKGRLKYKVPLWQLFIHDLSKFGCAEFNAYRIWFSVNDKSPESKKDFDKALLHHLHKNPHHWQYWILMTDKNNIHPIDVPEKYAREMLADWYGAGFALTGTSGEERWYRDHYEDYQFSEATRDLIETLFDECN